MWLYRTSHASGTHGGKVSVQPELMFFMILFCRSGGAQSWGSKVFAGPYHPSYYGMMVAEFYIAS